MFEPAIGNRDDFQSFNLEECKVLSLESFAAEAGINKIDLLKMDCEGAEYDIFISSIEFIRQRVFSLFIEVHKVPGKMSILEFKNFLKINNLIVETGILGRVFFVRNLNLVLPS